MINKKSLDRNYKRIESAIFQHELKEALDHLKELVISSGKGDYISQYESLDTTYRNLLKYAVEGVQDPERESIYQKLMRSVLELADVALHQSLMNQSDQYLYRLKKTIELESRQVKDEAITHIENLIFEEELSDVLQSSLDSGRNEKEEYEMHHELLLKVFNIIWLTDKFKEKDENLIRSIFNNRHFPWHEQAVVVSAITISLIRCFDEKKISLLADFAINEKDIQVNRRALVGLFISLYLYNDRIAFYPEIDDVIGTLADTDNFDKEFELISLQLLKSKETEKITRKLQEEILPEMVKFQPKLRDKLDLDNILSDDFMEDKNPNWEEVFEDAPDLLDKLQEISKLQMEGADVFMSTFSRLKHFDFFNDIINWFRPFYTENFILNEQLGNETEKINTVEFLDGLEQSFFMCNSDKYSFCLNIPTMPDLQKTMMIEMFNAELETLKELKNENEILDNSAKVISIYSQYIQDLYRFFKLHPMRNEFLDIFNLPFDFYSSRAIQKILKSKASIRRMAEYLFGKGYYDIALNAFLQLEKDGESNLEIFEKTAFCYQKLKQYEKALSYYKRAELFDANRVWNLKKIALCYRFLGEYENSLKYYLEAEKLEPDNLYILTYIGHSYLDLKEFKSALTYYYKVEVLAEGNKKVLRPIAWCSFVLGKLEKSREHFNQLIREEANKYDFMNLGHVEWCLGNVEEALKNYKLSISRGDNNFKAFMSGFEDDKKYLKENGIKPQEITWVLDYLKYQL